MKWLISDGNLLRRSFLLINGQKFLLKWNFPLLLFVEHLTDLILVNEFVSSHHKIRSFRWKNCFCFKKYFVFTRLFSSSIDLKKIFLRWFSSSIWKGRRSKSINIRIYFFSRSTSNERLSSSRTSKYFIFIFIWRKFSFRSTDFLVLNRCSVGWKRATSNEFEQCSIIGAFRSARSGLVSIFIEKEKMSNISFGFSILVKNEPNSIDDDDKYLMSIVQVETIDRSLIIQEENSLEEYSLRLNLQGKLIHFDLKFFRNSFFFFEFDRLFLCLDFLWRACEYFGYHPDELIGQTYLNYIHPDDLPIMIRAHQLCKISTDTNIKSLLFFSRISKGKILVMERVILIDS